MDDIYFYRTITFKNVIKKMRQGGEVYLIHKKIDYMCCYCECGNYYTDEFYIKLKKEKENVRIKFYECYNDICDDFNDLIEDIDEKIINHIVWYLKFYIEKWNINLFDNEEDNKKFRENPLYCEEYLKPSY